MNIYSFAKSIDYAADYIDMNTGYIYDIQEYGRAKKLGLPTPGSMMFDKDGIVVYEDGKPIGLVPSSHPNLE